MQLTKYFCLAFFCLALAVRAQEKQTPAAPSQPPQSQEPASETRKTRVLTIQEAIQLALEHNLDIQITRYLPQFDQYALNIAFAAWEPAFNFSASHTYDASPGLPTSGTTAGTPPNTSGRDVYDANLGGLLPSGLTYTLNGPMTKNTQFGITNSLTTYSSFPLLTLKQPILKNFWIDNARYQIQINKRNLKIDELALRLKIMTIVEQVKAAYFNLIFSRENVNVNKLALQLAEQLQAEDIKRVQVGALAPLDEKQAESQAASSRASLLQSEQVLSVQENVLKNLLSDNFSDWANVTPIPSEELVAVPEEINLQESWRRGVEQRPELLEARLNIEKQNITIKYNYNQLFPEVDLTGSYGHNAFENTFDNSLDTIRQGKFPTYSYGIQASIPLGNASARNTYRSAKASLKQILLQLKQLEQNVVVAIDNDVKLVNSDLQQVKATREARIYAEEALKAEQTKLANGKSTSFIVLQLQSNLTTARSAEIRALANYNIDLEQLSLDEGNVLQRNHIDLNLK